MAGNPVVRERMHWVLFEGLNTAIVLLDLLETEEGLPAVLANDFVRDRLRREIAEWWQFALAKLEVEPGRWIHELDASNAPSEGTWPGHPDAYHVAQMLLLPQIVGGPTFAAALR